MGVFASRHAPAIELPADLGWKGTSRKRRLAGFALIVLTALVSSYCAAVVGVSVSRVLLPGNELSISGITVGVPGIDQLQVEVPLDEVNISIPLINVDVDVPLGPGPRDEGGVRLEHTPPINILVLGVDHTLDYSPASDPGRSDTIMVLSLDPEAKTASILSFPRDTWLQTLDGAGNWITDRINTAYPRAEFAHREGGGPKAVEETIERNFGITIDHWVVVDWRGFTRIIDALNGVDIHVSKDMYDPLSHVLDPFGGSLKKGDYHFNGEQALAYSRYRADSDLYRIERQQQVIEALLTRATEANVLDSALAFWGEYDDTITTDLNTLQIPGLALLAKQIGKERLHTYSLGPAASDYVTPGGAAVLLLDPLKTSRIISQALPAEFHGGTYVVVENGAHESGWATRTRQYMIDHGSPIFSLDAHDTYLPGRYDRTVILNYTGDAELAKKLASSLGLGEDRIIPANQFIGEFDTQKPPNADIVVIAGSDLRLPESSAGG